MKKKSQEGKQMRENNQSWKIAKFQANEKNAVSANRWGKIEAKPPPNPKCHQKNNRTTQMRPIEAGTNAH
jgi:homospermidine synthase